jgi:hypothetical protein
MPLFAIDDDMHSDRLGEFATRAEAWAEVRRLAALPFDQEPNLPPCTKGAACRRAYEIVEYDDTRTPWREISRVFVVELTAAGARWQHDAPPQP